MSANISKRKYNSKNHSTLSSVIYKVIHTTKSTFFVTRMGNMERARIERRPDGVSNAIGIDIGTVRCFGTGDLGTAGQGAGWAAPEAAHCWNDGPEAALQLVTQRPDFRCVLVVVGAPLVATAARRQDVTLYGNGWRLGFWRLTQAVPVQLQAVIDPSQWRLDGKDATLDLAFHLPGSLRLSSVQADGDDRELGFCFHTLAIFPAPHER